MNTPVQPPASAPGAAAVPAAPVTVPVPDLPPGLSALLTSTRTVPATVASTAAGGETTFRTDTAAFTVPLPPGTTLPAGTNVTLQLDPRTQALQIFLARGVAAPPAQAAGIDVPVLTTLTVGTAVTATVVTPGALSLQPPGTPVLATARGPISDAVQTLLTPRGFQATVTESAANGAVTLRTSAGPIQVQAAAAFSVGTIVRIQTGPEGTVPSAPTPQTLLLSPSSTPTSGQATQGTTTTNPLAAGARVPVRIAAAVPPGAPLPSVPSGTVGPAALPLLAATVVGQAAPGTVLVETTAGRFSLPTGTTPAPAGARFLLEVTAPPLPGGGQGANVPADAARPFTALSDVLSALQAAGPGPANQIIQTLIPQTGALLAPALLFLLHAVRSGAPPRWLGPQTLRAIESGRRGTLDRLDREFAGMRIKAVDAGGAEWRGYQLPVLTGGTVEPLRLFVRDRRERAARNDPDHDEGRRFIVEVNFTRLGPFQFDTLVQSKHLQLMVRTHAAVPAALRDEIREVFSRATEALGLAGTVGYHVAARFDVREDAFPGQAESFGLDV